MFVCGYETTWFVHNEWIHHSNDLIAIFTNNKTTRLLRTKYSDKQT